MPLQETFGQMLKQTRESAGVGRNDLAKRVKLDPSHVYRLEVGGRLPSREAVIALAECLDITRDKTNEWLLAAGYAPVSVVASASARTRGRGHHPRVSELLTTDWNASHWPIALEAVGLAENDIRKLLSAMQSSHPKGREAASKTMRQTLLRLTISLSAPVRIAVIPLAGGQHRLLAPHIMQKFIIRMIGEAADAGIDRVVLVLPAGMDDQLFLPLKECLSVSCVPNIELAFVEQPHPIGLGDAVLRTEKNIGSDPFVVMLPDDVVHDRTGRTIDSQALNGMLKAFVELKAPNLIAVTTVARSKMPRCGVAQLRPREEMSGVHHVLRLVEKPDVTHPICSAARACGVVGRYLLTPEIFGALHHIAENGDRPIHLTNALQYLLANGRPVYSVTLDARRTDVGEVLDRANTLLQE